MSAGDFTWPLLILGGVVYFRNEIKSAFARIKAVGPLGVTLDAPPPAQQPIATPAVSANEVISGIKQFISPEQLEPAVKSIKDDLAKRTQNKDEQIEILVHALASTNIQVSHERTYRGIFGSQMSALLTMNNPSGATEETVKKIYDAAVAQYPELYKDFTFEKWVAFLMQGGLATHVEGRYEPTAYGRGFMKYVLDMRLLKHLHPQTAASRRHFRRGPSSKSLPKNNYKGDHRKRYAEQKN